MYPTRSWYKMEQKSEKIIWSYCRVSSQTQANKDTISQQVQLIQAYLKTQNLKISRSFEDNGISGKNNDRPGLINMMQEITKSVVKPDYIIIAYISRLARSVLHLNEIVSQLKGLGVGLIFVKENMIFTQNVKENMFSQFLFNILAAVSEFERDLILERTKEGRIAAKEKGIRFGRKQLTVDLKSAVKMRTQGVSLTKIAKTQKISTQTLIRRLKDYDEKNGS